MADALTHKSTEEHKHNPHTHAQTFNTLEEGVWSQEGPRQTFQTRWARSYLDAFHFSGINTKTCVCTSVHGSMLIITKSVFREAFL